MTIAPAEDTNILWFLPIHGDGRHLGTHVGGREVNLDYLGQIAQAADRLGYYGRCCPPAAVARIAGSRPRR